MMVVLFGHQGDARHKAEGLIEIREYEGPGNGIPSFDFGPAG
jgi:putative component of toxin-antitoxin plasmid stabilization module